MAPKLFRAQEVCDIAQVQPYVLRSWEKEFPGIGVQKSDESQRLYRQADVDQVLLIKRLVFNEGLTLAGARRKLEETAPRTPAEVDHDVAEVLDALASDARTRIAYVRDGLRSILQLLSNAPGTVVVVDDERGSRPVRNGAGRVPSRPSPAAVRTMPQRKSPAKRAGAAKPATMKAAAKAAGKPKRRASA
jgi:DNA-binding transcriptional MerR regulator